MRIAALAWIVVVAVLCAVLIFRLHRGIELQTDMMALLPLEERDALVSRAKDRVSEMLTERVFILMGDKDREQARSAGAKLAIALIDSGTIRAMTYHISSSGLESIGKMYFPYHDGLLTGADRKRLEHNQGAQIVARAIASVYGPSSIMDANLLRNDPFLLTPEFLSYLPMPTTRLVPDDGVLTTHDGTLTWVLLSAQLNGNVYSSAFQDRFMSGFNAAVRRLSAKMPGLQVLRVGAIFYTHAGTQSAISEAARLGIVSLVGTITLILVIFRAVRPLLLTLVAITVGALCAFAVCLSLFGGVHAVVLLFGVGLNGIAIDYCLQYVSSRFGPNAGNPLDRLHSVLPGIALGAATTLIGYVTLMLGPLPGLIQLAVFSAVGLLGSFITIVLWLPSLDSSEPLTHGAGILLIANLLWAFWEHARFDRVRWIAIASIGIAVIVGATRMRIDDDVRHQQALAGDLREQESQIRRLTGVAGGTQFLIVRAPNRERALQTEEALQVPLASAQESGALRGYQSLAQFVPSVARQRENRALVNDKLIKPYLAAYYKRLGIIGTGQFGNNAMQYLTPDAIGPDSPIAFLRNLVLESDTAGTVDLVLLTDVSRPDEIRRIAASIPGVRLVSPTDDISALLGKYHWRAMILIAVSACLMVPILIWRYGFRGGFRVMLAPAIAVLATPPLVALAGVSFTFFGAVALVLVLSIGFDYAVFCRETEPSRRSITMLGIWLAMATTLLSFGLLAFSSTYAVHSFGAVLLVGTTLDLLFCPIANDFTHRVPDRRE